MTTNQKIIVAAGKIEAVRIGSTAVPSLAQRQLRRHRVDELIKDFDIDAFGTPVVSERRGIYYIVDGQHRMEALKEWLGKGWEDQRVECRVMRNLTEKDEASMFCNLNNALPVAAFDKFRTRLAAGRPDETTIHKVVEREHCVISQERVPGAIAAVGTLCRVLKRSNERVLGKTLRLCRDAFGDPGFEATIIDGVGALVQRYDGLIEESAAAKQLGNLRGGTKGLLNKASLIQERMGGTKAHAVAAAAVDVLNSGATRGKKLPSWWKTSSDEGVEVTVD